MSSTERPTAPILGVDESKDLKAFYHNVAYKTNRVAINLEKMKVNSNLRGDTSAARVTANLPFWVWVPAAGACCRS